MKLKHYILSLLALLASVNAFAETVKIDGIWYNLIAKTKVAEVTTITQDGQLYSGAVNIPKSVTYNNINYSVTSIGSSAFEYCSSLTSITIPNSVTSIGKSAFRVCSGLTSVTIPSSVTSIGSSAFEYCSSLTSITIPNSVTSIGDYAFRNCSSLTSVHITDVAAWCNIAFGNSDSNPLTYARHLYMNGEEIKDLVIPSGVTSIGKSAFRGCSGLTSITIPNSVTSIGSGAFYGCSSLTSITIPNSVTSIGSGAFYHCSSLTSVTIPNSVTSIGSSAFVGCSSLTSVTIPSSVTSIGSSAFYGCSGLTSVTIPNSVTSIDEHAFMCCIGLTSITIPNSVTSISDDAFYECTGLTSITLGNAMKSINSSAFANCPDLTDVYCLAEIVPSAVSTAFEGSYIDYATLHVPAGSLEAYRNTAPWSGFGTIVAIVDSPVIAFADAKTKAICVANWDTNSDGELSEDEAAAVTDLEEVFRGNTEITSFDELQYFTGLTIIGNSAFKSCSSMTSITIPNSVTSIGSGAFSYCSSLISVTIPNSVTNIDEHAFMYCSGLTSITISGSVTSIGNFAFYGCSGMKDVYCYAEAIPSTGKNLFFSSDIASATLHVPAASLRAYRNTTPWSSFGTIVAISPKIDFVDANVKAICVANWDTDVDGNLSKDEAAAVTDLGEVFRENKTITSFNELQYFTGLTIIGEYAFFGCIGLTSLSIPESVTSIGNSAFKSCSSLTSVTIPNSVTSIGSSAFYGCSSLTSVTIPNSVTSIGDHAFYSCSSLTSLSIPESVTSIGNFAFKFCSSMTSITIPNSVTDIGRSTFENCSGLTSITIPGSVTSIGDWAFYGCSGMKDVYCYAEAIPSTGKNLFFSSDIASATLHVPAASLRAYRNTTPWSSFGTIVAISATIDFADANVKALCVANWDTNKDGELSETEAAAVTDLDKVFNNTDITSFNELKYFTGVTSIGNEAFRSCDNLTSIDIPSSVTSIGECVFGECNSLASLVIPNSVTSIGNGCFYRSGITSIIIPKSISSIGHRLFEGCPKLASVIVDSENPTYDSRDNCNGIVETISNTLIAACMNTFIPNSVTSFGDAFYDCKGLISLSIPNSVTAISSYAFLGCTIESLSIASSVTSIANGIFYMCSNIANISVDSNNPVYDSRDNCNAIIETASNTLITGCLSTVIPNTVTAIGGEAFRYIGIASITIPSSVVSIDWSSFWECHQLKSVIFLNPTPGNFPETIGLDDDCIIYVPKGSKAAYEAVFPQYIIVEEGEISTPIFTAKTVEGVDMTFKVISEIEKTCMVGDETYVSPSIPGNYRGGISIPSTVNGYKVTRIGSCAFNECGGLTSVSIPETVTSIGNSAFKSCSSLTSVTIPNSVTSIGERAFYGCKLLNVLMKRTTPIGSANSIFDIQTLYHAMLYVPTGYWKTYAYDESWYQFINIREITMTEEEVSGQQAYTLMDARTFAYSVYDPVNDCIGTINSAGNIDENNPNHSWQMIESGGMHYLYNMGAKKFVRRNGNAYELTDAPEPIELANGDKGLILGQQADKQWALVSNERLSVSQLAIEDVITGVSPVLTSPEEEGQVYNLAGQRLSKPTKGINIQNGRKFIIK